MSHADPRDPSRDNDIENDHHRGPDQVQEPDQSSEMNSDTKAAKDDYHYTDWASI